MTQASRPIGAFPATAQVVQRLNELIDDETLPRRLQIAVIEMAGGLANDINRSLENCRRINPDLVAEVEAEYSRNRNAQ